MHSLRCVQDIYLPVILTERNRNFLQLPYLEALHRFLVHPETIGKTVEIMAHVSTYGNLVASHQRKTLMPETTRKKRQVNVPFVVFLIGLAVILLAQQLLIKSFHIPSTSMVPTLEVGDYLYAPKVGFNAERDLNRGDIIIFTPPKSWQEGNSEYYVKRVIGLPGDTISSAGQGTISLNGEPLDEPYLNGIQEFPGEVYSHTVPDGKLFVMGDNREASNDSRQHENHYIDMDDVFGKPFMRMLPVDRFTFF